MQCLKLFSFFKISDSRKYWDLRSKECKENQETRFGFFPSNKFLFLRNLRGLCDAVHDYNYLINKELSPLTPCQGSFLYLHTIKLLPLIPSEENPLLRTPDHKNLDSMDQPLHEGSSAAINREWYTSLATKMRKMEYTAPHHQPVKLLISSA